MQRAKCDKMNRITFEAKLVFFIIIQNYFKTITYALRK